VTVSADVVDEDAADLGAYEPAMQQRASDGGACSDDAAAHGGELHSLAEGREHHAEDGRLREAPRPAVHMVVIVVFAEVQLVDAVAVLVVVEHHV
jgi:hypothetical protein